MTTSSIKRVKKKVYAPTQSAPLPLPSATVIGRCAEREEIRNFLESSMLGSAGGSTLYISGSPGVGKTLSVTSTVGEFAQAHGADSFVFVSVNAMSVTSPLSIFDTIAGHLAQLPLLRQIRRTGGKRKRELAEFCAQVQDGVEKLANVLRVVEKPVLVMIDEIDRLVPSLAASKNRDKRKANVIEVELLSALLRLPFILPPSVRISIVGIANSMDLALNLESFYGRRCVAQSLAFKPYTADELREIVTAQNLRLTGVRKLDAAAVELCVRKIASFHGDCRKLMDICRQAATVQGSDESESVSIKETAKLLENGYSGALDSDAALKTLPLQHLLVLAAACKVSLSHPNNDTWPINLLRDSLLETTAQLCLPNSDSSSSTAALVDKAVALSQCGLLSLKDPGKGRAGVWKLQIPAQALRHTLTTTNSLIANALAIKDEIYV